MCQISFNSVGITVTRSRDRLTKNIKRELTDFIKRCYVTVHVNFDEIFYIYIVFRECYMCAKFRLNRWG